ncbi:MAG: hypothetical protein Q9159_001661 [Coniocarpon cinnabarinum]
MYAEDQRFLHEDIERLEEAITTRYLHPPTNLKDERITEHEIADFLDRIQTQSQRLRTLYDDVQNARAAEVQRIGTGDVMDTFMQEYRNVKEYHRRYPGAPVEHLERSYQRRPPGEGGAVIERVRNMFTGEESLGKYFDLIGHHEAYLNLHPVRSSRRLTYLQFVDSFDHFQNYPQKRVEKLSDEYFSYINNLADYLESFFKRVKPLEGYEKLKQTWDREFEADWSDQKVPGWEMTTEANGDTVTQNGDGQETHDNNKGWWCNDCGKDFKNENVYKGHLTGKKHQQAIKEQESGTPSSGVVASTGSIRVLQSDKERTVASREFLIRRLAASMSSERQATKTNIERRAGMTDRERQQEIDALMAEEAPVPGEGQPNGDADSDSDDERIHNPLKLPLSWDGRPIPFWLYKLHGLGVEYPCEICGGFVYQGRRAYEKHFSEPRHTYGLKCLGITNSALFREITSIEEATQLQEKLAKEKKTEKKELRNVEEMEDSQGNVMPKTVYEDLRKQGII